MNTLTLLFWKNKDANLHKFNVFGKYNREKYHFHGVRLKRLT